MPIFWRYLLGNYLKVLFLAIFSFITILLVSRLQEIAQFAALGASVKHLALFVLYQIPYILPIALPISCLISSMILFQRLSHTHELTALRACGFSLKTLLGPVMLAGLFLALVNFYVTSELSTISHLATRKMAYEITSVNPLILLQNAKIAKLKGAYVQMDPVRSGEETENLLIALKGNAKSGLHLFLAKHVDMKKNILNASDVSLISSVAAETSQAFDHLIIENEKKAVTPAAEFARLLRNQGWKISNDHLKFSLLRVRLNTFKERLHALKQERPEEIKQRLKDAKKLIHKCYSEIIRRFSLGIAPLTFTLMGMAFGMEISRHHSKRGILTVISLAAFSLVAFFTAKELDTFFYLSASLFLIPHIGIACASYWTLQKVNKGIE